ncbi:unnamed protein product, partial [Bubo scandiacus]
ALPPRVLRALIAPKRASVKDHRRATSYRKSGCSLAHTNSFPLLNNHLLHMLYALGREELKKKKKKKKK